MAYIFRWEFREALLDKVDIGYSFEEFHVLWNDDTESYEANNEYLKVKQLLKEGEKVYAFYYDNDFIYPRFMSEIVQVFNKVDFNKYAVGIPLNKIFLRRALKNHKVENLVWLEKDFRCVKAEIDDFTHEYEEYKNLAIFDEEKYEEYLSMNQLVDDIITSNLIVDKNKVDKELFIETAERIKVRRLLLNKKNIILQGPPGVGKTFISKKLVECYKGVSGTSHIQMVQFHQSYSYEDFIQGYKPASKGGFKLKNGIFYNFCKNAMKDPLHDYYFIIDEINRGNLSKIFGELLMLIESDKRGPEYAIQLTYSEDEEKFYVPENVYIIGLMNTADRSLAVVDYALRRRFAFITMKPYFDEKFVEYLKEKGASEDFIHEIVDRITALNELIETDPNLGNGFLIGHSYFCSSINLEQTTEIEWYNDIIENEIAPTLEEYWYDDLSIAQDEIDKLYYK